MAHLDASHFNSDSAIRRDRQAEITIGCVEGDSTSSGAVGGTPEQA